MIKSPDFLKNAYSTGSIWLVHVLSQTNHITLLSSLTCGSLCIHIFGGVITIFPHYFGLKSWQYLSFCSSFYFLLIHMASKSYL